MGMDEWLAKATQGVDMDSPSASLHIFLNLMQMLPWAALFWWSVGFVVVGALLGWWRGRLAEGILWSAVLGPLGWIMLFLPPRHGSRSAARRQPPPLRR